MSTPTGVGLNGAMPPYGLGIPRSSGIYALGRGSAVVRVTVAATAGSCGFVRGRSRGVNV